MGEEAPKGRPYELSITVPPKLEAGVYANFLSAWQSPYEFTLDFAVSQRLEVPEDEAEAVIHPYRVVSRVKIPVTIMFDVLQALNGLMTDYEKVFGEIRRPHQQEDGQ